MSSLSLAVTDSATMLRRNLLHMLRYPSITVILIGLPVVFLLLFVYVLGGTLGAGLVGPSGGRADYVDYVAPGMLMFTVVGVTQSAALSVSMDMTEGIVDRFRTMAISRASVLTGHVLGTLFQTMFGLAVVTGVALLVGFRPNAGAVEWIASIGLLATVTFALTWLMVAMGLTAKSVETASNLPMPLVLLPFFGSGFVPTDSMPTALRLFAEYQPFTPFIETLRGLLMGTPIGNSAVLSIAWCGGIALVGYLWARAAYDRRRAR
jgi:ABC-2 type transport system permease protein